MTAARRTQAERRTETIGRLIDATIDSIAEIGYHRTSLGEVCTRSGVSRGGLFRHFDSRLDLVVAAAEEVAQRHLTAFDELRTSSGSLDTRALVEFARARVRDRINSVWFELLVAARTDAELRERLAPTTRQLYDAIEARALEALPGTGMPDDAVRLAVTSLVHMLDGEAIIGATYPRPDLDAARLDAVAAALAGLQRHERGS